ncbi:MAG: hypothetical protein ABW189_04385 [Rickettsiales bacterium]
MTSQQGAPQASGDSFPAGYQVVHFLYALLAPIYIVPTDFGQILALRQKVIIRNRRTSNMILCFFSWLCFIIASGSVLGMPHIFFLTRQVAAKALAGIGIVFPIVMAAVVLFRAGRWMIQGCDIMRPEIKNRSPTPPLIRNIVSVFHVISLLFISIAAGLMAILSPAPIVFAILGALFEAINFGLWFYFRKQFKDASQSSAN